MGIKEWFKKKNDSKNINGLQTTKTETEIKKDLIEKINGINLCLDNYKFLKKTLWDFNNEKVENSKLEVLEKYWNLFKEEFLKMDNTIKKNDFENDIRWIRFGSTHYVIFERKELEEQKQMFYEMPNYQQKTKECFYSNSNRELECINDCLDICLFQFDQLKKIKRIDDNKMNKIKNLIGDNISFLKLEKDYFNDCVKSQKNNNSNALSNEESKLIEINKNKNDTNSILNYEFKLFSKKCEEKLTNRIVQSKKTGQRNYVLTKRS